MATATAMIRVTVDELLTMVNIAVGTGQITIDEILMVVDNVGSGCVR